MTERQKTLKIFSGLLSLFFVSGILIVAFLALLGPWSMAWFATNKEVSGSGMQVKVDGLDITISYYCKGPTDADYLKTDSLKNVFEGLLPGDTVWIKIKYDNGENVDRSVKVYLSCFDGCEAPLVIDGRFYYLSTQLKVVQTGDFLLNPPIDSLSYETEQSLSDLKVGELTIPSGASDELEFSIQFVNYTDVDQSAYMNFGNIGSECCNRIITSDFR